MENFARNNKYVGWNNRVGGTFLPKTINVQDEINMQEGFFSDFLRKILKKHKENLKKIGKIKKKSGKIGKIGKIQVKLKRKARKTEFFC